MALVGPFEAAGKRVACDHCGLAEFRWSKRARWYGYLVADRNAELLTCTACGRQHPFKRGSVARVD